MLTASISGALDEGTLALEHKIDMSTASISSALVEGTLALEHKIDMSTASISSALVEGTLARFDALEHKINILEYFSHGGRATYVGNNRVLVKAVVANNNIAFFVEANDRLLSPWFIVTGGYETQLTDYFVRELRPDSHCIDVGANFGYFTCLMARFCPQGRVIGIEPDEHVYEIARDNVFINDFNKFTSVLHAAASNSDANDDSVSPQHAIREYKYFEKWRKSTFG